MRSSFPILLLLSLILADFQTSNGQATQAPQPASTSSSTVSQQSAPAQQSGTKKVWTNEDVADLREHAVVSTVGATGPKTAGTGPKPSPGAKSSVAYWYRDQIQRLQAKIPPLDEKIHNLQAALNGQTVNSVRIYGGVRDDDWRDQLARFQKQREEILAKIASLQDEARHRGVPPNSLP